MIRAFLVDDEPLALKRLSRLLTSSGRVEITGSAIDPLAAVTAIRELQPEVIFLDIQMPELSGFDVVAQLEPQPLVVFTTAYDQFALRAFEVNSVDYLLKPVTIQHLERALSKLERILTGSEARPQMQQLLDQITAAARNTSEAQYPQRLPSRIGERIEFVDLAQVTHFFAMDKLTWAATPAKNYVLDWTIHDLEKKLDPQKFVRIHRSTIVALGYIQELHPMFAGRMLARLKDSRRTELNVARERVRELKERLGII
jgi:two-component system LytT family response regulator